MPILFETINTQKEAIKSFSPEVIAIPNYITDNLKYDFYDWQKDAFENFLLYENPKFPHKVAPTHLMFNMATGTGKTLLMAANIIYYFKQGYKHFIFFVNQNNIVDKTENNFINSHHTKYLFKEKIVIDEKTVNIKKVDNFSENPQGIEIKFTTIQKLYNDIHIEKENQTTLADLHKKNIIMLADEAHHLNADTKSKKGTQEELDLAIELTNKASVKEIEKKGWEHTVLELILNKNSNGIENKNVLLEFTATIPSIEQVADKYEDKIIARFGLKEFLAAGYTKEINLVSSTFNKKDRVLFALLFNWYRHKIALKHGIPNFKPVILFRSKTIDESKKDYEEFLNWTSNAKANDFQFLKEIGKKIAESNSVYKQGKARARDILEFIKKENISLSEIAQFIKDNFSERSTIITNSKTNKTKKEKTSEEQEKLLNSLEDKNNHIRAIFTVDRLTEGWDVLNLFDIVRLYKGQNVGGGTTATPDATIKEKQLIGRGVRYFPFSYNEQQRNKRKFDDDLKNELRFLEELYYYTFDEESRYIYYLKQELRKDGYIRDGKVVKNFKLKKEFLEGDFYNKVKIWYNEQQKNPNRRRKSLKDIRPDFFPPYKISSLELHEEEITFDDTEDLERLNLTTSGLHVITKQIKNFDNHIFRKAINIKAKSENSLFQFNILSQELAIDSIDDLLNDALLGGFVINIIVNKNISFNEILNKDKLSILLKFLGNFQTEFSSILNPHVGSDFIAGNFKDFFGVPKTKSINEEDIDETIPKYDWYVLDKFAGNSEERALIEFIKNTIGNLEEKYDEKYLLRNEEIFKLHDFEKGRVFQPDFILFLKNKSRKELYYQVFIEPKGKQFIGGDNSFKSGKEGWKEIFLEQIAERYGLKKILKAEDKNYHLIGLPFFNADAAINSSFVAKYNEL